MCSATEKMGHYARIHTEKDSRSVRDVFVLLLPRYRNNRLAARAQ